MELKEPSEEAELLTFSRLNCTFMELKAVKNLSKIGFEAVLIVPLWN